MTNKNPSTKIFICSMEQTTNKELQTMLPFNQLLTPPPQQSSNWHNPSKTPPMLMRVWKRFDLCIVLHHHVCHIFHQWIILISSHFIVTIPVHSHVANHQITTHLPPLRNVVFVIGPQEDPPLPPPSISMVGECLILFCGGVLILLIVSDHFSFAFG